jgi:hypothetical protein
VSGLAPGPMRPPLRSRAYVEEDAANADDAAAYAPACVALLSAAGRIHRGEIWEPLP